MGRQHKKRVYHRQPCKGAGCSKIANPGRRLCYDCKALERGHRPCGTLGCERMVLPSSDSKRCEICRKGSSGTGQCSGISAKVKRLRSRCAVCEGMSWRRPRSGCPQCREPFALEPYPANGVGLQRRDEPLVKF